MIRTPFDTLAEYERRSLAHVVGLPEQLDAPGLWRGVGYRIGARRLASGFGEVLEILPLPQVTQVPGAQPWLLGLANVRGSLLPVCDVHRLLGEEHHTLARNSRVLVYNNDRIPAGFLVDEVSGYRQFTPTDQRRELMADAGVLQPYLLGAFVRESQPWLALSLHKLAGGDAFNRAGW